MPGAGGVAAIPDASGVAPDGGGAVGSTGTEGSITVGSGMVPELASMPGSIICTVCGVDVGVEDWRTIQITETIAIAASGARIAKRADMRGEDPRSPPDARRRRWGATLGGGV